MATALSPIVPGGIVPFTAVAPVEAVAPPPIAPQATVQNAPADVLPDYNTLYERAVDAGDSKALMDLSKRVPDPERQEVIRNAAAGIDKRVQEIDSLAKPVAAVGGLQTPQGRLVAVETYKTIADEPQKGRAFLEWLMGNKDWRKFVTGGTPKTEIGYDTNGKQLERTFNELGQTISVRDAETGQLLDRKQVAERGGFLPSLENALGFQQQKKIADFNAEAFNKSNAAVKDWSAKAPELKELYGEMRQRLQGLIGAGLTEKQRREIGLFTTRTMGYSQTISDGLSALAQKLDDKTVTLSNAQQKALQTILNFIGAEVRADGSMVKKNGESVTKSDLKQAQSTLNNSDEFGRNFTQSKEDFIRNEVFRNLGEAEMKNLGRIVDLQEMIEKSQLELTSKHGTLPFLINPKSYQLSDEFSRGEALALIGEFNADATAMYRDWRDRQLQVYKRAGTIPTGGELEAAFIRTPEYRQLRQEYAERNRQILSRPEPLRQEMTTTPAQQWSIDVGLGKASTKTPEQAAARTSKNANVDRVGTTSSVPAGYTRIGTTPDGKEVFRDPKGKTVVRQ